MDGTLTNDKQNICEDFLEEDGSYDITFCADADKCPLGKECKRNPERIPGTGGWYSFSSFYNGGNQC